MAGKKQSGTFNLTENEKRFSDEYLKDFNGKQAAIRAGYSKQSATSQASRLLTKANVIGYLNSKKQKVTEKLDINFERTLNEIGRIAFLDPRKFFNEDGTFKGIHELDEDTAAALAATEVEETFVNKGKIKTKSGRNIKAKFWDKTKALEMLAKYFKMYSDAPVNPINLYTKRVVFK